MDWIALQPWPEQGPAPAPAPDPASDLALDPLLAWGWHALAFTPRVARVDEALLLEVSGSWRLFGGPEALLHTLLAPEPPLPAVHWGRAATSLVALALLRTRVAGRTPPPRLPEDLPLSLLGAAVAHLPVLERAGCRTWGQLRALPRAGVARRFGTALLDALDAAWGLRPEAYAWLALPEVFDQALELPAPASTAPELMPPALHLLAQLQRWLRARQRGVLALELEWALDLRRLDGRPLPSHQQLALRTGQPLQGLEHLQRLLAEQLARARLAAPARHLRLRSLETVPWVGASLGFLPGDSPRGEPLHQLVERLSARLGEANVLVPRLQADWRPERMQRWEPAAGSPPRAGGGVAPQAGSSAGPPPAGSAAAGLYPPWLLPEPLPLQVRGERPWHQGPLRLLTRRQRIETGWWEPGGAVVRDYCIARSEGAGLLWVFCEQRLGPVAGPPRWYLQGLYA